MVSIEVTDFNVIRKIGEGAMSEVFLANRQGQNYALKVLKSFFKEKETYVERLKHEASILKKLNDDRIVKIYDVVYTKDERICLVTEFVEGKTIEKIINDYGEFKNSILAASLISEILLGLEEAHKFGIVHRDLKPENIIITPQGRVKITDFGIAKNLESQELTITGFILGSPAFMSPEQAEGNKVDERSDLFSIGILLYYLTTGQLPFQGQNFSQIYQSITKGEITDPRKLNESVSPRLLEIIQKSLKRGKYDRYQKCYEFRYAIMRFLDHIQSPSPHLLITNFYNNESLQEIEFLDILKTVLIRADKLLIKDSSEATLLIQQALEIDPENKQAWALWKKLNHKPPYLKFLLILLMLGFAYLGYRNFSPQELQKKVVFKDYRVPFGPNPIPNTISDKVSTKKASIKKEKLTKAHFLVDDDVEVLLDGKRILNPSKRPVIVKPGYHILTLKKANFAPIKERILLPKGKTTTINAR